MRKLDNTLLTRQIAHFAAVAEAGSLNKAAETIGIAQSALTRSLRQLEQSIGCELFARGPRGSVITPEGQILLECTNRIRSEVSLAMMAISNASEMEKPLIRVGVSPSFGLGVLPAAVTAFQNKHPNFRVQIRQSPPANLIELLVASKLDFYVGALAGSEFDAGIEVVPLPQFRSLVYARSDHSLAQREVVTPIDLLPYKWVSLVEESGSVLPDNWRKTLSRVAYENGSPAPTVMVETNSAGNALSLTANGDYLVCLSSMFMQDAKMRGLVSLSLSQPLTAHKNGIAFRSAIGRNVIALDLADCIDEEAKRVAEL